MDKIARLASKIMYHLGFGYIVHCEEFNAWHWSPTWDDAMEWLACYPASAKVTVCKGAHQMIVASR